MGIDETPRFQRYKARKRDNWTIQKMAYKMYGVRVAWPAVGVFFLVIVGMASFVGWEIPGKQSYLGVAIWFIFTIWLPLWVIAALDRGRGFGVFIGRLTLFLDPKAREIYQVYAQRELAKTDEELIEIYTRTRPQSSR